MTREIVLILARAANGTIGRDNAMPWHLPADLKRFKALTMGQPMIMGRKTFESFPAPLPGRRHIVLTRDADWRAERAEVAHSLEEALALAGEGVVWVIGGAEVYRLFMPLAHRIEMTEVLRDYAGDTAVAAPGAGWREVARSAYPADGERPGYAWVTLVREDETE